MKFEENSLDELYGIRKEINKVIKKKEVVEKLDDLKKSRSLSNYTYYFFSVNEGEEPVVGFGSEQEGYIDDRFPEGDLGDDFYDLRDALGLFECMTCTYDFAHSEMEFIEKTLIEVGMKKGEPAWL
jgi:hypothetical protein